MLADPLQPCAPSDGPDEAIRQTAGRPEVVKVQRL